MPISHTGERCNEPIRTTQGDDSQSTERGERWIWIRIESSANNQRPEQGNSTQHAKPGSLTNQPADEWIVHVGTDLTQLNRGRSGAATGVAGQPSGGRRILPAAFVLGAASRAGASLFRTPWSLDGVRGGGGCSFSGYNSAEKRGQRSESGRGREEAPRPGGWDEDYCQ